MAAPASLNERQGSNKITGHLSSLLLILKACWDCNHLRCREREREGDRGHFIAIYKTNCLGDKARIESGLEFPNHDTFFFCNFNNFYFKLSATIRLWFWPNKDGISFARLTLGIHFESRMTPSISEIKLLKLRTRTRAKRAHFLKAWFHDSLSMDQMFT